jgi:hypothetical protein
LEKGIRGYVNGKMRPVELFQEWGGREDKGE